MCQCLLQTILAIVNGCIAVLGAICMIIGGLLAWGVPAFKGMIRGILQQSTAHGGLQPEEQEKLEQVIVKLIESMSGFGIAIFVFGCVMFCIALIGAIGACCNNQLMLTIYMVLHGILVAATIIFIIIYFARPDLILRFAKEVLEDMVVDYVSYDSSDFASSSLNLLMPVLDCCGVNDGHDFDNATKFKRQVTYEGQLYNLKFPLTCCKMNDRLQPSQNDCPKIFTEANSNYKTGCWVKFTKMAEPYLDIAGYTLIGIVIFQVLLMVCANVLICMDRKGKVV